MTQEKAMNHNENENAYVMMHSKKYKQTQKLKHD